MKQRLKDAVVDTRVVPWGYDQRLVDWLGDDYVRWDGDTLTVRNGEGTEVDATPGHVFARWEDGVLVVNSAQAAARHYEPVDGPGADIREGRVTRHENTDAMFEHLNADQGTGDPAS